MYLQVSEKVAAIWQLIWHSLIYVIACSLNRDYSLYLQR